MKKYIYRLLALVVLILNMNEIKADNPRITKFVYKPSGNAMTKREFVDFVVHNQRDNMTVMTDRSYYRNFLYEEIGGRLGITVDDAKFEELFLSGRVTLETRTNVVGFKNTGWVPSLGYAVKLDKEMIPGAVLYYCLDGEPLVKANCGNVIIKNNKIIPKPEPVVTKGKMLFLPCYNKMIEMAPDGRYSKDSNFYLLDDGSWEYFTGVRSMYGREFKKLDCTPKVETKTVYQTQVVEKVVYVQPEPVTTYQQMPQMAPMGRVYNSPGWWETPPMPNYNVRQRTVFFSLALNLIPNYQWQRMPQMYGNSPVYYGQPFDGGNPVYSVGQPFGGGNQYTYGSPFDAGSGNQGTQQWGGSPFGGGGTIPGIFQRVP